jgi:hypothetical protein
MKYPGSILSESAPYGAGSSRDQFHSYYRQPNAFLQTVFVPQRFRQAPDVGQRIPIDGLKLLGPDERVRLHVALQSNRSAKPATRAMTPQRGAQ